MAFNYYDLLPSRTEVDVVNYPFGKAKNTTDDTTFDGTPYNADVINDQFGFFQKLLSEAGITPNGAADTVVSSQYFEALTTLFSGSTGEGSTGNLENYKTDSNTWDEAFNEAKTKESSIVFPSEGLVTFNTFITIEATDRVRSLILNGCRVEFKADASVSCEYLLINGIGTMYFETTLVTQNPARFTFTEECKYVNVDKGVIFEGDLKIAQLANDMVGPTSTMVLQTGHDFEVGKHVTSSWNNTLLPNSVSRILAPNTGDETYLNRAESVSGNTITLSYDIAALTIPSPAYIFQNTRFDRDFIRILGDGVYRFDDVTFNKCPSYMIGVRDETQKAEVFFNNVDAKNYAIDGFVFKCAMWVCTDSNFGQQYDPSKSLAVLQMKKSGIVRWDNVTSERGNADTEFFVFGVSEFPDILITNSKIDGKNLQPFDIGVYNSPAPVNGNQININNMLHPFVTSSDGLIAEAYDGGSFRATNTKFINIARTIFGTTYATKETFSFEEFSLTDCVVDCSPVFFDLTDPDNSNLGKMNITNCKINGTTYTLNAVPNGNTVKYTNCDLYIDNSNPAVVTDGAPARLENVFLDNCTLRGWWSVRANANARLRDVGLYPKEGVNPITLSIQDPFFDSKQNNLILLDWDAKTLDSFIPVLDYFGGNAIGSDFSANSPFFLPFKVEYCNADFETSNEFFGPAQAGVSGGNESYRMNMYRQQQDYPPLPTSGGSSLYVPINSKITSNVDNTTTLVTNRSAGSIDSNSLAGTNDISFTLNRAGIAPQVTIGDFIGIYYTPFDIVYWYKITALVNTSGESFNATVTSFPLSGGDESIFQDVTAGDACYWIKTGLSTEEEQGLYHNTRNDITVNSASDSSVIGYRTDGEILDTAGGKVFLDNNKITFGSGVDLVDINVDMRFPDQMLEPDGYMWLQVKVLTSAGNTRQWVGGTGLQRTLPSQTKGYISISANNISVQDGDYLAVYAACEETTTPSTTIYATSQVRIEVK